MALNLHRMCAAHIAHLGKTPLIFGFLSYGILLPTCLCSSSFLPLALLFIFCPFIILVALVYQTCYLYFYQHRFHFQTDSTAPFHNMVLVSLQLLLCLHSLLFFLNRRLLICNTVYCLSFPVWLSVYNFSRNWHFYLLAPRICILTSWLAPKYRHRLRFPLQMAMNSA